MVREDIRRVGKEVWGEVSEGFTKGKELLRKRVRKPKDMCFAVVPPQYYHPVHRRRMKGRRR